MLKEAKVSGTLKRHQAMERIACVPKKCGAGIEHGQVEKGKEDQTIGK